MPDNATMDIAHVAPLRQPAPQPRPPQPFAERQRIDKKLYDTEKIVRVARSWLAYLGQRNSLQEQLNLISDRCRHGPWAEQKAHFKQLNEIKQRLARVEAEMMRLERLHGVREIKRICGFYQGVRNGKYVDHDSYLRGRLAMLREVRWRVVSPPQDEQ